MNIKLDENMPAGLAPILTDLGHHLEFVSQSKPFDALKVKIQHQIYQW